jgi:hypothetical protein
MHSSPIGESSDHVVAHVCAHRVAHFGERETGVSALSRELTEGPRPNKKKYPPRLHHGASEKSCRCNPADLGRISRSGNHPVEIDHVAMSFPVRLVRDFKDPFWWARTLTGANSLPTGHSAVVPVECGSINVTYRQSANG